MSVYKRTIRGKASKHYYIDFVDENGKRRTVSSRTSDKRRAQQLERQHVDRALAVRSGLLDPVQERLRAEAARPLQAHVEEYIDACRARGDAAGTLDGKQRTLAWMVEAVAGCSLPDLRADAFDQCLARETERGASARTVNLKLEGASAFLTWCVKHGRLAANPLRVLSKRNEVIDRRRPRRVLTREETSSLLAVARAQAAEVPGAALRPLWYLLPLLAGLRRGDLEGLRWKDVKLEGPTATVTIRGGKAKRRVDVLPLHQDLVDELRAVRPLHVLPSAPVFATSVMHSTRRKDFQRAGIVLETDEGFADLHALRHTFGTRLAAEGVAPAVLQQLMRHASIQMTMTYYVHLGTAELHKGLGQLAGVEPRRATQ